MTATGLAATSDTTRTSPTSPTSLLACTYVPYAREAIAYVRWASSERHIGSGSGSGSRRTNCAISRRASLALQSVRCLTARTALYALYVPVRQLSVRYGCAPDLRNERTDGDGDGEADIRQLLRSHRCVHHPGMHSQGHSARVAPPQLAHPQGVGKLGTSVGATADLRSEQGLSVLSGGTIRAYHLRAAARY
jgi:hypothetical protein